VASSTVAALKILLGVDASGAAAGFKQAAVEAQKFERQMRSLTVVGQRLEKAGTVMTVGITVPFALAARAATRLAADAVESENLFKESMGRMADAARSWSTEISAALGLNSYEVRKNVGTFNVMLHSMGLVDEQAFEMSKTMTELAYDMTSFYNLDPSTAFEKLRSGLAGQVRPLRDLGINIDDATVKQWAMTHGMVKTGQEMTYQQKVIARYNLILEQTAAAQGDLARTIDSPANRLRVLKARTEEAAISFGQLLLPVVSRAAEVLKTAVDWFNSLDEAEKRVFGSAVLVAAAMGPVLLVSGKLLQSVVVLGAAKRALAGLIAGRLVPAQAAQAAATVAATAAMDAQAAAATRLSGSAGLGALSRMMAQNITVSEAAAVKLGLLGTGAAAAKGATTGLAASLSPLLATLGPLAAALGVVGLALGAVYLATKKWGDAARPLEETTRRTAAETESLADAVDRVAGAAGRATGETKRYAEQLDVLGESAEFAVERARRISEAEAEVASTDPGLAALRSEAAETAGVTDGLTRSFGDMSGALTTIANRIAIVDREWGLWRASFKGTQDSLEYQAALADAMAKKMEVLRAAIAEVAGMKGADARETQELTLWLLDLKIQLAEATAEYQRAKAAMAAGPQERSRMVMSAAEAAAKRGVTLGEHLAWAVEEYIRRWSAVGRSVTREEAERAIYGPYGLSPEAFSKALGQEIPGLQSGGIVTRPTLALIGERGPEAVVPLSRSGPLGPVSVTINVHAPTGRADDIGRVVRRVIQEDLPRMFRQERLATS